jgi:hypothetical protein
MAPWTNPRGQANENALASGPPLPDDLASNGGRYRRASARYVGLIRRGLVQCAMMPEHLALADQSGVVGPGRVRQSGAVRS